MKGYKDRLKKKETFEDYLFDMFMKEEPMTLDDDLPDAFTDWLCENDPDWLIEQAQKWGDSL